MTWHSTQAPSGNLAHTKRSSSADRSRSNPASRPTSAAVSPARCHNSWCPVSATAAPKRRCSWAFSEDSSRRLPLRLPVSGKCSSISRTQTNATKLGQRLLHLLLLVHLDHVPLLHVGVVLEDDAALHAHGHLADVVLE